MSIGGLPLFFQKLNMTGSIWDRKNCFLAGELVSRIYEALNVLNNSRSLGE